MSTARILIVDDEPQICRVMRALLCAAGYAVADARSGEETMEKLQRESFDLVLLDVNLPESAAFRPAARFVRGRMYL